MLATSDLRIGILLREYEMSSLSTALALIR